MRRNLSGPSALLALTLLLSACGGGGGGGTPATSPPSPTVTATPGGGTGGSGGTGAAFTCPNSATDASVGTAPGGEATTTAFRRTAKITPAMLQARSSLLAVTYAASNSQAASAIEGKARGLGAQPLRTLTFDRTNLATRAIAVNATNRDSIAASLRSTPGVIGVAPVQRRFAMKTNAYITSDPFFKGNNTPPLYEQDGVTPGQWDMHVEQLEHAFAYSQSSNGSTLGANPNALGSTTVKLAVIDTGMDVTQKDLADAHVVRTQCFLTDTTGNQSTSSFVADPDGHGTDVTGIAAAKVGNSYGFAGDGGNVSLLLYRVFPKPDASCGTTTANPPAECTADSFDIATAINDAVTNGANVINLSLGGNACVSGQDPDSTEGAAIANAIAHNVIVVAASGNGAPGTTPVGAPACDPGVIAAGASAYNDGQPNASGFTSATRKEYVTSYTEYGSVNSLHSASSWGIVAPGGDGIGDSDANDNLHWIENIWTSTPWGTADAGNCGTDPFGGAADCRIEIAGTSMSTPHVAGAAALILSVNAASYGTPAKMKALLCSTADDIGDAHQGCGRLNIYRAIATALHDPTLP